MLKELAILIYVNLIPALLAPDLAELQAWCFGCFISTLRLGKVQRPGTTPTFSPSAE
jgi:hypothetical protein